MAIGSDTKATATPDKNQKSISWVFNLIGLIRVRITVKPGKMVIINAIIPSELNVVTPKHLSTIRVQTNETIVIIYAIDKFNITRNLSI